MNRIVDKQQLSDDVFRITFEAPYIAEARKAQQSRHIVVNRLRLQSRKAARLQHRLCGQRHIHFRAHMADIGNQIYQEADFGRCIGIRHRKRFWPCPINQQ